MTPSQVACGTINLFKPEARKGENDLWNSKIFNSNKTWQQISSNLQNENNKDKQIVSCKSTTRRAFQEQLHTYCNHRRRIYRDKSRKFAALWTWYCMLRFCGAKPLNPSFDLKVPQMSLKSIIIAYPLRNLRSARR